MPALPEMMPAASAVDEVAVLNDDVAIIAAPEQAAAPLETATGIEDTMPAIVPDVVARDASQRRNLVEIVRNWLRRAA